MGFLEVVTSNWGCKDELELGTSSGAQEGEKILMRGGQPAQSPGNREASSMLGGLEYRGRKGAYREMRSQRQAGLDDAKPRDFGGFFNKGLTWSD